MTFSGGVLYLLKSGCQWRMLPAELPQLAYLLTSISGNGASGLARVRIPFWSKSGWRGPTKQWTERADQLLYRGLPERQEHGHRWAQGL